MRAAFQINGTQVPPGARAIVDLELPKLNSHTHLAMPVHIVHGRRDGPRLFVSAAIHGDEVNGVEIIRRVLELKALKYLRGTLVAIPVVNVYGLIHHSRYLPDRRDLNRSFPGSERGSLTARVANLFMEKIVACCSHGIDLHTGALHRTNLPQIRANLDDPETERLARAFGAPVLLDAALRDGSLRQAAADVGIPMLLYEAGEALRYDEVSIRAGVQGVLSVMRQLGMLKPAVRKRVPREPFVARNSTWVRAPDSGMLRVKAGLGGEVRKGQLLAQVSDPYSGESMPITAHTAGVVIGRTEIPMVHEGEALFHIARFAEDEGDVAEHVEIFQQAHSDDPW